MLVYIEEPGTLLVYSNVTSSYSHLIAPSICSLYPQSNVVFKALQKVSKSMKYHSKEN